MDLESAQFFSLFALALSFQIVAIAVRKLFLSLFFSFAYTLIICVILIAMGHSLLAMATLWLSAGLSHFALILTSLLIGSHNHQKPERQLSFSLFLYIAVILALAYTLWLIIAPATPQTDSLENDDFAMTYLVLGLMSLSALVGSLILIRRDHITDPP
jgi:hypothetical protein